jgi:hypothetical protein
VEGGKEEGDRGKGGERWSFEIGHRYMDSENVLKIFRSRK